MLSRLKERFDSEPVMVLFAIRTIVLAGIAFGLNITIEQFGALMIALEAIAAVFTRGKVTPNTNVESTVDGSPVKGTGNGRA